jgi:hypothetical protein
MGVAEKEDGQAVEEKPEIEGAEQDETGDGESEQSEGGEGESGDEEVVVQIGDEEPPASEEEFRDVERFRQLRERYRETSRELARLKAERSTVQADAEKAPKLGPKPKLSDPDIDFDEEKFEAARDKWDADKRAVDAFAAAQEERAKKAKEAVAQVHQNYAKSKEALKVKDFQEAEDEATNALNEVQQSIVIAGATNPAAMVYALGRNPARLQALASIKDPVKFAVEIGKLEGALKVTKRTSTKPAPEVTVRGGSASAPASTATLDRLRAEADRTGDRTKVAAFLRTQGKGK